jgi:Kef-type K+ transport system membrane component KefB
MSHELAPLGRDQALAQPPHHSGKGAGTRAVQGAVLLLLFAVLYLATHAFPGIHEGAGTIGAVGFLLLVGTLMSELVETIGIPHLTGYLLAGVVAGPHVLGLIDHHAVNDLTSVNTLALSLIALEGGAELRLDVVRRGLRSLAWATLLQSLALLVGMTGVFFALRPWIPFLGPLAPLGAFAVAILWGVLAVTRSPSAALGILSQTRASGPVASFTLTFVMSSDVVVVVLLTACITIARPLLEPTGELSLSEFRLLGREILGTVALGTTLGLLLAAYLRLWGRQLILVFLALGLGLAEVMRYLQYDPLLAFMTAGFVVQNLSRQGEKFIAAIHGMGSVVYVIFFATAGAHLDIPLLRTLWPVAVMLAGARALLTWMSGRLASNLAADPPAVKKWGWAGLVSQAGLALGLAGTVARSFPSFGDGFRALAIATVALNEFFGPILFKLALDRAGETSAVPAPNRPSLVPAGGDVRE